MGKLSARKKAVKRTVGIGNVAFAAVSHVEDLDARIETIQLLIPLGLQALTDELQRLSSSTVSRRYVKATARKLAQFQERSLADYDLVALLLDGKSFADEQIIIALGVTLDGRKIPLGFVQAATENERVCRRFLADLVDRGLQYEAGLRVVIDGAKGLYKAVMSVLITGRL